MKWLLLLFIFLISFDSTSCNKIFNENRIVYGKPAPKGLFNFLPKLKIFVPMRKNGYVELWHIYCSSTIISSRHVLTDAHCVTAFEDGQITRNWPLFIDIRPIEKNNYYTSMEKFGMAQKVYIHRGYSDFIFGDYNDIAILEFPAYVNFSIDPVKLAKDYVDNYNDTAIAAGYGYYIYNATANKIESVLPPTLLYLNVDIHPFDPACIPNSYLSRREWIKDFMYRNNGENKICAGNIPLERIDHGDSGGPLLYEKNNETYQIGLCDGVFDDPENMKKPGMYTRISYYCKWIEKVTKNEAKCVSLYELPPPLPVPTTTKPQQPSPYHPKPKPKPITLKETTTKDPNDAMALKSLFNILLFIGVLKLLF